MHDASVHGSKENSNTETCPSKDLWGDQWGDQADMSDGGGSCPPLSKSGNNELHDPFEDMCNSP
eukprot:810197-Karenia_brevis.AAC.1